MKYLSGAVLQFQFGIVIVGSFLLMGCNVIEIPTAVNIDQQPFNAKVDNPENRSQQYNVLMMRYAEYVEYSARVLHQVEEDGEYNARLTLGVGVGGTLSGIAAAALVVASPANAVWVATFSGLSAGAVGFQTNAALQGFSREAKVAVYNELRGELKAAQAEVDAAFDKLNQALTDPDPQIWQQAVLRTSQKLNMLRAAALYPPTAAVGPFDDTNTARLDQIEKQLQQIIDAIPQDGQ